MKITVKNADLSRELNLLEKIVGKKPTISVLANVLIRATMGTLSMSATDLEIGLVSGCPADVDTPGAVTLPAKKLVDIVRAQSDMIITLAADTRGAVKFTSGGFVSRLQSLPASDFPTIPDIEGHPSLTIPRAHLKEAIAQVRYAISDRDQKYYTKGALFVFDTDRLTFVATDSARLAITAIPRSGPEAESILVPAKCLDELSALLSEPGDGDITFAKSDRHIFFDLEGRLLISRQVEGKFPGYNRIIPKDNDYLCEVARDPFISVLKRLILIDDVISLKFRSTGLEAFAASVDVGDGVELVEGTYNGPDVDMRFRGAYLLDFLGAATSPTVTMAVKNATSAALLVDNDYRNVVMGMVQ